MTVEHEQGSRDIYCNPKTGYQSSERLYRKALEDGLHVNRKLVKEWLNHKTHTLDINQLLENISLERHMLITLVNKFKWTW